MHAYFSNSTKRTKSFFQMGRTPLHYAAASANSELYDVLVAGGANEDVVEYVSSTHKKYYPKPRNKHTGIHWGLILFMVQKNVTARDYRTERVSPGSSGVEGLEVAKMLDNERSATYGKKIYLKMQLRQLKQAIEKMDLEGERAML